MYYRTRPSSDLHSGLTTDSDSPTDDDLPSLGPYNSPRRKSYTRGRAKKSSYAEKYGGEVEHVEGYPDGAMLGRGQGRPDPLAVLRKGSIIFQFLGAGCVSVGTALLVTLYVTGVPSQGAISSSSAVLILLLVLGCLASIPSFFAVIMLLVGGKATRDGRPPRATLLKYCAGTALGVAVLYAIAGIVLWVLLQTKSSFVSFCQSNTPDATTEKCEDRYNRDWVIWLAVVLNFVVHVALGFPVFKYAHGNPVGKAVSGGIASDAEKALMTQQGHSVRHGDETIVDESVKTTTGEKVNVYCCSCFTSMRKQGTSAEPKEPRQPLLIEKKGLRKLQLGETPAPSPFGTPSGGNSSAPRRDDIFSDSDLDDLDVTDGRQEGYKGPQKSQSKAFKAKRKTGKQTARPWLIPTKESGRVRTTPRSEVGITEEGEILGSEGTPEYSPLAAARARAGSLS